MSKVFTSVQDSGKREEFDTGSRRDTQEGKARYGLIPPRPLFRLAMHYTNGADKYGDHNWTLGQPASRFYESMFRHMMAFVEGKTDEDHLAAVAWNAFALMHFEEQDWFAPNGADLMDMRAIRGDATPEELVAARDKELAVVSNG